MLEIERDLVQILIYSSQAFHGAAHNPQMVETKSMKQYLLQFGIKVRMSEEGRNMLNRRLYHYHQKTKERHIC